jgi:hypothetical protein
MSDLREAAENLGKPLVYRVRYTIETIVSFDADEDPTDQEIVCEAMAAKSEAQDVEIERMR